MIKPLGYTQSLAFLLYLSNLLDFLGGFFQTFLVSFQSTVACVYEIIPPRDVFYFSQVGHPKVYVVLAPCTILYTFHAKSCYTHWIPASHGMWVPTVVQSG